MDQHHVPTASSGNARCGRLGVGQNQTGSMRRTLCCCGAFGRTPWLLGKVKPVIGVVVPEGEFDAKQPLSLSRDPFHDSTAEVLFPQSTRFASPLWLRVAQLEEENVRAKPGAEPIQVRDVPMLNVDQLEEPPAVLDPPPQFIDGNPVYGPAARRLAAMHPDVPGLSEPPTHWYSVHGRKGLVRQQGMRAVDGARKCAFWCHWKRRKINIVSALECMPVGEPRRSTSASFRPRHTAKIKK